MKELVLMLCPSYPESDFKLVFILFFLAEIYIEVYIVSAIINVPMDKTFFFKCLIQMTL